MRQFKVVRSTSIIASFIALFAFAATPHAAASIALFAAGQAGATGTTGSSGATGTTGATGATGSTGPVTVKAARTAQKQLVGVQGNFVKAIAITAEQDGKPKPGVKVDVRVTNDSDSLLYSDQAPTKTPDKKLTVTTDKDGVANISLLTNLKPETEIQITPLIGTDEKGDLQQVQRVTFSQTSGLRSGLGSKLSFFQLFVGTTFSNDYDSDGKSKGFGNAGQLIRLTFDTMWPHQGRNPQKHTLIGGNWRTDFNAEFSKFPFGATGATGTTGATGATGATGGKGLADAFTGHVGLTWEPNRWAHYDAREDAPAGAANLPSLNSDDWPFDLYRVAIFARAGVTTRAQAARFSGDTSFSRGQLGLRFTHRRSRRSSPIDEDSNIEPIRFVELSFGRFSKYGSRNDARRVIVDAGLRIGALSNNVFPIYAGIHLNSGPGPDDLRVFLGMLMKLDELANLIKSAGVKAPGS